MAELSPDGAGTEWGEDANFPRAPGVAGRFWAPIPPAAAARHSCTPRDNERKALAQGLASGSRWITRVPALAVGTGSHALDAASRPCGTLGVHATPVVPKTFPSAWEVGFIILRVQGQRRRL